jgi:hypothetical protein
MFNIFDLGQNKGDVTQMIIDVIESIPHIKDYRIYGFEANYQWYKYCVERFKDNTKVICIHRAISNIEETVKLFKCKNGIGDSIFSDKNNVDEKQYELVKSIIFSK